MGSGDSLMWLWKNKVFVLAYTIASILLTKTLESKYLVATFITMLLTPLVGYVGHVLSHQFNFCKMAYEKHHLDMDPLTRTITYLVVYSLDFHRKIHHNTCVNKKYINLVIEALQNIVTQGFALMWLNKLFLKNFLVNEVILLYAFIYTTLHLINYNLYKSKAHENHHTNPKINYGPYFFDILFNTADEEGKQEDWNILSINIIIITLIICLYKYLYSLREVNGI
jgi:hypothetical protein